MKNVTSSKEAYDALVKLREQTSPVKLSFWHRQFSRMKKDHNTTMQSHLNTFQGLIGKIKIAKIAILDNLLVIMLLETLPEKYQSFITATEIRDALPEFKDIKTKLLEQKMRLKSDARNGSETFFARQSQR